MTVKYAATASAPLGAALQPPGREREQQMPDDRGEQRRRAEPDRVEEVVVGRAELARRTTRSPPPSISRPVRLAGRRHHANRPVPMNDQPTSSAERGVDAAVVDVVAASG